jgi:hypothetical protein
MLGGGCWVVGDRFDWFVEVDVVVVVLAVVAGCLIETSCNESKMALPATTE